MKYLLLICCYFVFSSCHKDANSSGPSINGEWTMVRVEDRSSGQSYSHPAGSRDVTIKFTGNSTGGIITGKTQTNTIIPSSYSIGSNRTISIPGLGSTQVYEPEWGSFFLENITFATAYQIIPGRTLVILTPNLSLKFSRN